MLLQEDSGSEYLPSGPEDSTSDEDSDVIPDQTQAFDFSSHVHDGNKENEKISNTGFFKAGDSLYKKGTRSRKYTQLTDLSTVSKSYQCLALSEEAVSNDTITPQVIHTAVLSNVDQYNDEATTQVALTTSIQNVDQFNKETKMQETVIGSLPKADKVIGETRIQDEFTASFSEAAQCNNETRTRVSRTEYLPKAFFFQRRNRDKSPNLIFAKNRPVS